MLRGSNIKILFYLVLCCAFVLTAAAADISAGEYDNMALIPEGPFVMGSDSGGKDARPAHTVYLNAFFIDRYEVTNADFAKFLNKMGNRMEGEPEVPWITIGGFGCKIEKVGRSYAPVEGYENHPVVMVTYHGAQAYARWVNKRLPTEAEWEKAARGGLVGVEYPWGDEIDTIRANYGRKKIGTTPVGIYPPNGFGLYDMAGNVAEMVSDFYSADYYRRSLEMNPTGPEEGERRVTRGGDYLSHSEGLLVYKRREAPAPYITLPNVGFRLVKDLE